MPAAADPGAAGDVVAALDALRARAAAVEEDLLACLAVVGEPGPQRVLDDWLDQGVDALRALAEEAAAARSVVARYAVAPRPGAPARPRSRSEAGP
ncbi:MAG TPA: hypothetical protein VES95_10400 [Dermatophilaceae bacterium]|nr:hypothetical protein [Dermatophilaceae bacterium]